MALLKVVICTLLFFIPCLHGSEAMESQQILYTLQSGDLPQALKLYQQLAKTNGEHDLELLQQIGLGLLDQGYRSRAPDIQLLTLFGAGISTTERTLYILEDGLRQPIPQLQLIAMELLMRYHHDQAGESLEKLMGSDLLQIRFEALQHLARMKHGRASSHAEALMTKVPEQAFPLFAPIFAEIGDARSTRILRKMLIHTEPTVRAAAILSAAKAQRDDLIPQIRSKLIQHSIVQEASVAALGILHDKESIPYLEKLAKSQTDNLRLTALRSLYALGKKDVRLLIESEAKTQNPFAIFLLRDMPGSEDTLFELMDKGSLIVRINACIALLQLQDRRSLSAIKDLLIHDSRDLLFEKISSHGKGLHAVKPIPNAKQNCMEDPSTYETSLKLREKVLEMALKLPEKDYLNIIEMIFESNQNDLVPAAIYSLESLGSNSAQDLLKKYSQKAGAPLIRNYCNLALFKLKVQGPYEKILKDWVTRQQEEDFIRLRPYIPWEARDQAMHYELTPHETSRLLLESFEVFAKMQDDKGIDVLIEAMIHGNPKNRYALAGLLLRAVM
jgi:HEAT repeat protein